MLLTEAVQLDASGYAIKVRYLKPVHTLKPKHPAKAKNMCMFEYLLLAIIDNHMIETVP